MIFSSHQCKCLPTKRREKKISLCLSEFLKFVVDSYWNEFVCLFVPEGTNMICAPDFVKARNNSGNLKQKETINTLTPLKMQFRYKNVP
jgi:hypothetical protein